MHGLKVESSKRETTVEVGGGHLINVKAPEELHLLYGDGAHASLPWRPVEVIQNVDVVGQNENAVFLRKADDRPLRV